jgi:hypothetical protein
MTVTSIPMGVTHISIHFYGTTHTSKLYLLPEVKKEHRFLLVETATFGLYNPARNLSSSGAACLRDMRTFAWA